MLRKLSCSLLLLLGVCFATVGQDVLDTARYSNAELFVEKQDYDVSQRLQEIQATEGKEVTVFEVTGKQHKIKTTYTGICEMSKVEGFSDKQKASLIVVKVYENGDLKTAYFPLTNSGKVRIYLTEKMK